MHLYNLTMARLIRGYLSSLTVKAGGPGEGYIGQLYSYQFYDQYKGRQRVVH